MIRDNSALLRRLNTRTTTKQVFFTDDKSFYLNLPVSKQNSCVWSAGKSLTSVLAVCSLNEQHLMVSAEVCWASRACRLLFVEEKAKVNADYYVDGLLPELIADCKRLLPADFIFQQGGAPAHTVRVTQAWLQLHWPQTLHVWNHWTITSGTPCWKSIINSSCSARRHELKVAWHDHLERAATSTNQQSNGKPHQVLDGLCGCQWRSFRAFAVTLSSVHLQVCILISATKTCFFKAIHTCYYLRKQR